MKEQGRSKGLNYRQNKIMEVLKEQNAASVSALALQMKVSEVTIRKDLIYLEEEGLLCRVHGAAILVNRYTNDRSIAEKEHLYIAEKVGIAKYAASLILPRDTIMIASGTTTQAFTKQIEAVEQLTAITSTFNIASILSLKNNIDVIQLGGLVKANSLSVVGPFAEQMLSSLSCSKLFIGVDGVDFDYGITTTNHVEANLHRLMIDSAQKVIVLVDHSKFGLRGFSKICELNQIDEVVTDSETSPHLIERLKDFGIKVTVVEKETGKVI